MSTQEEKSPIIAPPPYGFMTIIAKKVGASATTVRNAIRYGTQGEKADKVREAYRELYLNPKKD
ncbi:MAG: hypothetical protein ACRC3G_04125 [Bacteroidales bacterium]